MLEIPDVGTVVSMVVINPLADFPVGKNKNYQEFTGEILPSKWDDPNDTFRLSTNRKYVYDGWLKRFERLIKRSMVVHIQIIRGRDGRF